MRELLREQLAGDLDDGARRTLHAQLAHAAREDGQPVTAIEHWLDAEAWPEAAAAIASEGPVLLRTSPALVRSWIAALPPDVSGRAALRALEGQSWWLAGDNMQAIPALRDAVDGGGARSTRAAEWVARSILVDLLFTVCDPDRIPKVIEGWNGPGAEGAFAFAPAAAMFAAAALASFARFEESDRLAEEALAGPESALIKPLDALRRLFLDLPAGHADEICVRLETAVRETELFDPVNRMHLRGALAIANGERGAREEALAHWHSIRESTRVSAPVLADATHAWCALLQAQAGRLEEAETELAQYRRLEPGIRSFIGDLAPAAMASLRGDAEATEAAATAALLEVEGGPILFRYFVGADLVPALAEVGRLDRAAEVLHETLGLVDEHYPGESGALLRGRLLAQRAWLAHLAGDTAAADEGLIAAREAAGAAAPHVMRREWERLEPVVWEALERGRIDPAAAVGELDRAFPEGLPLVPFIDHPNRAVRAAALGPAVRSGDPGALTRIERLAEDPEPELAAAADLARKKLARILPPLRFMVLRRFGVGRGSWRVSESDWGGRSMPGSCGSSSRSLTCRCRRTSSSRRSGRGSSRRRRGAASRSRPRAHASCSTRRGPSRARSRPPTAPTDSCWASTTGWTPRSFAPPPPAPWPRRATSAEPASSRPARSGPASRSARSATATGRLNTASGCPS